MLLPCADFTVDKPARTAYYRGAGKVYMRLHGKKRSTRERRLPGASCHLCTADQTVGRRCLTSRPTTCRHSRRLCPPQRKEQRCIWFPHGPPPFAAEARQRVDFTRSGRLCQFSRQNPHGNSIYFYLCKNSTETANNHSACFATVKCWTDIPCQIVPETSKSTVLENCKK